MKIISETNAKGIRGFLLYTPIGRKHFFRVHNKDNPTEFTDYKITAEEIEIELVSDFNALVKDENGNQYLDYSRKALRK